MRKRNVFAELFSSHDEVFSEEEVHEAPPEIVNRAEMGEMRAELKPKSVNTTFLQQEYFLGKIVDDLKAAEENLEERELEVKRSREQLKSFKSFARSSEKNFEGLVRLTNEKDNLQNDVNRLEEENSDLKTELEEERANVAAIENRRRELRDALESARADMIESIEKDSKYREEVESLTAHLTNSEAERISISSSAERLRAENEVLVERIQHAQSDLSSEQIRHNQLQKEYEEVASERRTELESLEHLTSEHSELAKAIDRYQTENAELQSRLVNADLEKNSLSSQLNEKIRIGEEELFSLRAKANSLKSELRVKSEVLMQAQDDLVITRSEARASKELANDLHQRLAKEKAKADRYQEQVMAANTDVATVTMKLDGLIADLNLARKENERLSRALKIESSKMEFMMDPTSARSARNKAKAEEEAQMFAAKSNETH